VSTNKIREALATQSDPNWTTEDKLNLVLAFLHDHAPDAICTEGARYIGCAASGKTYFNPTRGLREEIVGRLTRLHPIIAAQGIRLKGVGAKELRDIGLVLQGIESRIANLERKVKRPWLGGGMP